MKEQAQSENRRESGHSSLRCPSCGRPDVRRSKPYGLLDMLAEMAGRAPVRCRSCRHRFYVRQGLIQ